MEDMLRPMRAGDIALFDMPDFTTVHVKLRNDHMVRAYEAGLYMRAANARYAMRLQAMFQATMDCHVKGRLLVHPAVMKALSREWVLTRRRRKSD